MSRDVACRVSMFTTTYKTFNINSLSNQIVETQNFASLLPHWNDNFDTPSTGENRILIYLPHRKVKYSGLSE